MTKHFSGFLFALTFGICTIDFIAYIFGAEKPDPATGAMMLAFYANYRLDRKGIE